MCLGQKPPVNPHPSCLPVTVPSRPPVLQVQICSPTAQRSARPWVTLTAAGCRALWPPMGARVWTTVATSTCLAWTQSQTQRYLKAQRKQPTVHSPHLVKRRLSLITPSTIPKTSTVIFRPPQSASTSPRSFCLAPVQLLTLLI